MTLLQYVELSKQTGDHNGCDVQENWLVRCPKMLFRISSMIIFQYLVIEIGCVNLKPNLLEYTLANDQINNINVTKTPNNRQQFEKVPQTDNNEFLIISLTQ